MNAASRDLVIDAPASALATIAAIDSVEWIQRQPVFVSMDFKIDAADLTAHAADAPPALTGYESGARLMGLEKAWSRGFDGRGQIACVADTGLDTGSADTLAADFKETFYKGYNSGLGTETWQDSMGHGTHVSGSVAGTGAASGGVLKGGAHGGKLIMEGLWSALLDNLAPGTDFERLIGPAYADGARIHSNSWGSPTLGQYDTFAARVDEYMWNHPDMLVLFAAGNSGVDANGDGHIDENSIGTPATAKNVLTVGASENQLLVGGIQKPLHELRNGDRDWGAEPIRSDRLSDNPNGIAAFSSRGPTEDGRIKPEIVAPGTNIVSTRSHHPKASPLWGAYNADYAYAGGTSMATPLTAGAATVLRQYLIEARKFAQPSAALVKATLIHTATDLFPGQYGTGAGQELPTRRPNVHEGYGRVNMDEATALDAGTLLVDEKVGVASGESKSYTVQVGAGGVLRATMTYMDPPASAAARTALVNDLDVRVVGADGQVFEKKDRVNNTEMLELSVLARGAYTVLVAGINVPQGKNGKQPFALAVTAK
jgi:subtilisin family serine protease